MLLKYPVKTQCSDVYRYVSSRAFMLQNAYLSDASHKWAARQLAVLRRAASTPAGNVPDAWSIEFSDLPESLVGLGDYPSPGENAVNTALTLFAFHQQSQWKEMHCAGKEYDIGAAMRRYVYLRGRGDELLDGQLPRRFAAMSTADSFEEAAHHARQLVRLLRSEALPIDYGRLARQMLAFQIPYLQDSVRLEWGRAFAQAKPFAGETNEENHE